MSAAKSLLPEYALLGLLALLWGSSYLLIKIAVADIPPLSLVAARSAIAAIMLTALIYSRGQRLPSAPAIWRKLLVLAFLNSIGAWTVLAWGQQFVDAGLASVLNSTSPIFIFFITFLFTRHETTSLTKLAGACLGVFGVAMIVGTDALTGLGQQVAGQLAVLSGAVLYAGAAIYSRNLATLPAATTAAGTMIWASLCLIPFALIVDKPWTLTPSSSSLMALLVLAIFGTGIALIIYFRLVRTLGSMGVASQAYLRAGIGVLLGMIFLGETLSPIVALGLAAAILGVLAINWPSHAGSSDRSSTSYKKTPRG